MQLSDVEKVAKRAGITIDEAREALVGGERGRQWNATLKVRAVTPVAAERAAGDEGEDPDNVADAGKLVIEGYAAVFDEPTMLYSWLRETLKRGAFKAVLRDAPDVRYLVNHAGLPYARTTNGTLTLEEHPRGLFMRAELDEQDPDSVSLYRKIERGDVTQQSFAFIMGRSTLTTCECEGWSCDCVWERDIHEVDDLLDASAVTYPAYPTTNVEVARDSSEQSDERDATAGDAERRDEATGPDTSTACSGSDQAAAIRLHLTLSKGAPHHVPCTQAGARAGRS